jgi:hypothetical protein
MKTRIYKTHSNKTAATDYYMTYAAAVLAVTEAGYTLNRDADPANNLTGWATRDGIFGVEDIWIGWIDVHGVCPKCAAAELADKELAEIIEEVEA